MVADSIENDIKKQLAKYDDYKWVFTRRSCDDSETVVLYDKEWMFVSEYIIKELMAVLGCYNKRYRGIVFSVGTYPCKKVDEGWLYAPSFEFMVFQIKEG